RVDAPYSNRLEPPAVRRLGQQQPSRSVDAADLERPIVVNLGAGRLVVDQREEIRISRYRGNVKVRILRRIAAFVYQFAFDGRAGGEARGQSGQIGAVHGHELHGELAFARDGRAPGRGLHHVFARRDALEDEAAVAVGLDVDG